METLRAPLIFEAIWVIVGVLLLWTVWDWIVPSEFTIVGDAAVVVGAIVGWVLPRVLPRSQ
jgi:hypothetical protein